MLEKNSLGTVNQSPFRLWWLSIVALQLFDLPQVDEEKPSKKATRKPPQRTIFFGTSSSNRTDLVHFRGRSQPTHSTFFQLAYMNRLRTFPVIVLTNRRMDRAMNLFFFIPFPVLNALPVPSVNFQGCYEIGNTHIKIESSDNFRSLKKHWSFSLCFLVTSVYLHIRQIDSVLKLRNLSDSTIPLVNETFYTRFIIKKIFLTAVNFLMQKQSHSIFKCFVAYNASTLLWFF